MPRGRRGRRTNAEVAALPLVERCGECGYHHGAGRPCLTVRVLPSAAEQAAEQAAHGTGGKWRPRWWHALRGKALDKLKEPQP